MKTTLWPLFAASLLSSVSLVARAEVAGADVPRYQILAPQPGQGEETQGEFNIGYNPHTGRIMVLSFLAPYRITPPERLAPPLPDSCDAQWENVAPPSPVQISFDPILWTDQASGRTLTSNFTYGTNFNYSYSDDDGATWIPVSVAPPNGGADHETIGTGPYPASSPFKLNALAAGFQNATYYCSQNDPLAFCQRSDDGGRSYGPGRVVYGVNTLCHGLHGHVHVTPDGTVYLPSSDCGATQGGAVSFDAGETWSEFLVPGSVGADNLGSDPSVGLDADGTAYFCYIDNENHGVGHARVAVSRDHGRTWTDNTDLGAPFHIANAVFPEATVGGDSGRAACGFVGTTQPGGDPQSLAFQGIWYLYIATTYDGGKSWTTVNVTPNDPVQGAGGIRVDGATTQNRNLLDFNEVTTDEKGRVLFGFDKGCVGACITDPSHNSFVADLRVARQTGGKTLLARYDPAGPSVPAAPCLGGTRDGVAAHLAWKAPDSGGAAIAGYRLYRGTAPGQEAFVAQTASSLGFDDTTLDPTLSNYWYKVTAVNGSGEGIASNTIALANSSATHGTKRSTAIAAKPEILQITPTTVHLRMKALLNANGPMQPLAGKVITFSAPSGAVLCTATTDSSGTASCGNATTFLRTTLNQGYVAKFAGDGAYLASSARGALVQ